MSNQIQLKPCPFCGEAATMVQFKSAWGDGLLTEIGCGSSTCALSPVTDEVPAEIAIEAWNRRPTEEAQAREIERLRGALREVLEDAHPEAYMSARAALGESHDY